jgi:hypothetical protein
MEIARWYLPKEINWFLIPDLLRKAELSIPEDKRVDSTSKRALTPASRFVIRTLSQFVEIETDGDFLEFLRSSSEAPTRVEARLDCFMQWGDGTQSESTPPYFVLKWNVKELEVEITRSASRTALTFLEELEKILQIEPLKAIEPTIEPETNKKNLRRTIFIAHSFDEIGLSYAYQLTKFLSLLGFEIATGEGFSPEKVSSKVKRRLSSQELALAIISERDDFTWLIQEMAGASFTEKPLFLLVEEGTDFKSGVLGDLEYIRFAKGKIAECFTPVLEGLRELGFRFS